MTNTTYALGITAVLCLVSLTNQAQPVLTSSVLPSINHHSIFQNFDAENFNPGPSGANVTWDFSNIVETSKLNVYYKDPNTVIGSSGYPSSNYCITGDGEYKIFYSKSSNNLEHVGSIYTGGSNLHLSNPELVYNFPMGYEDAFLDTFNGYVDWLTIIYDRWGTSKAEADAYGTLILPNKTINNVLRIKTVVFSSDSFGGKWIANITDTLYEWHHPEIVDLLFSYSINTSFSSTVIQTTYNGAYIDSSLVGIDDFSPIRIIHISPNPNNGIFNLQFNESLEDLEVEVRSILGGVVAKYASKYTSSFDVEFEGPSGFYYVSVKSNGKLIGTKKIVKR